MCQSCVLTPHDSASKMLSPAQFDKWIIIDTIDKISPFQAVFQAALVSDNANGRSSHRQMNDRSIENFNFSRL